MQLSEAMRLGAMLHPQGFGSFFSTDAAGVLQSCALGAAVEALGCADDGIMMADFGRLAEKHPAISMALQKRTPCPLMHTGCGFDSRWTLEGTIPHLNDHHKLTREQIADFVETLEQQQATPVTAPDPEQVPA